MKKLIFGILFVAGISFTAAAQANADGTEGSSASKPKSAVEVSKGTATQTQQPVASASDSTAKKACAGSDQKNGGRKACCKKNAQSSCGDKNHKDGAACCKKKTQTSGTKND